MKCNCWAHATGRLGPRTAAWPARARASAQAAPCPHRFRSRPTAGAPPQEVAPRPAARRQPRTAWRPFHHRAAPLPGG
eukprot:scaffold5808_cov128-Isochrysis_galbana.AAC.22